MVGYFSFFSVTVVSDACWTAMTVNIKMFFSPDLNRDVSGRGGLSGQPKPGVDSNVSAWSRPSVVAVHTAVSPGFCTPRGCSNFFLVRRVKGEEATGSKTMFF